MFLLVVFLSLIICLVIIALPALLGLTKLEKNKPGSKKKVKKSNEVFTGYVSTAQEEQHKRDKLKEKINLTNEDLPMKISLKGVDDSGLRNRNHDKLDTNRDPNEYDYDLDELISEETERVRKETVAEFYKDEMGKDKEELV